MKRRIGGSLLALGLVVLITGLTYAQPARRPRNSAAAQTNGLFAFVPQSDAIVVVDVHRLLKETLPQIFAGDTAKLAQINLEIDKFKAQTGIDPGMFDRVVIAAQYIHPTPAVTKFEPVAIATGNFNPAALTVAARLAAKGKARDEKYRGSTITILTINDQMKVFGLWNMRVKDLAITALSSNTIAVGTPATVRAAIDAGRTARRDSTELVSLATRDPQAVIGFGANVPPSLWTSLDLGTDQMAQDASAIRQAYGSVGTTATDVSLMLVARTDTPAAAKNLSDTLVGLKQIAGFALTGMSGDKRALAQTALDNLKIDARGNELEIRTQVAAANLASLMK